MLSAPFVEGEGEPAIVVTWGRVYAPYVPFGESEWHEAITPAKDTRKRLTPPEGNRYD